MIEIKCRCGKVVRAPDEAAGKVGKCPSCGERLQIPRQGPAPAHVALPAEPEPAAAMPQGPYSSHLKVEMTGPVEVRGLKSTSGFGIAALALGILAAVGCWVPFLGLLSIPVAALGALFGIIGVLVSAIGRRSGVGIPVAGTVVSVVAIVIAVASTGSAAAAIATSTMKSARTNQEQVPPRALPNAANPTPNPQTPPAVPAVKETTDEERWAAAGSPVKQGDVQIRIVSAEVGKVPLKTLFGDETSQSEEALLSVTVEITNLSQTKKLEYRTWAGADVAFDRDYGSLVDNFANSYKRMSFGMHEPVARNERASIYPAKSLTDVLVFEPPVSQVQYLRLELPGDNFGGSGMIRIQIPAAMLSRR